MPIPFDPEIGAVLAAAAAAAGDDIPVAERGDALALRAITNETLRLVYGQAPGSATVSTRDVDVEADDGTIVTARWYVPEGTTSGSAVVYVHGGGLICGSVELYDQVVRYYSETTGVPFLSVEYRLAPEHTGERLARDAYSALAWLHEHALEFGVDPERIAIMGDSGGGAVAAGAAILARNDGTPLARQILIYPMLDDRNVEPDQELAATATWTYDNNFTGWNALLPANTTEAVSEIASPARLVDYAGLAPAFIDVGDLDIFRDESITYAHNLLRAGVSCELHVRAGAPHAFEWLAPAAQVSRQAISDRIQVIRNL
ncbi:alpha/beta hydrolase [Rhodococcus cercidiphylli]|uniref:Alpha/beta hydrolase fold domain-containing protein n=1 Tax=Rhodococcus cercidiphylli TaxID=489916 RepID=A0ABU4AWH4_9NOCA|nr:alpha/beta hydrolase fold domain-containing protein [Rhodococcus cercidiphylli]MDV6230591.1 alpha/beta hydrolase fold domain-containing protein [Rhodococcus cercidiphylli]